MSDIKNVDDNNFDAEVLQSTLPVLVDFGASWCGPCQRQLPILEKFATINRQLVKVVSIDIDEAPKTVAKFGIRSVPTLVMLNKGTQTGTKVGLTSLAELSSLLIIEG
jgi:thioredoxin 1